MSEYQVEILDDDEYFVDRTGTGRTVLEFAGPKTYKPGLRMADLMLPGSDDPFDSSVGTLNLTNGTFPGGTWDFQGGIYTPELLSSFARVNWRSDSILPFSSYRYNQTGPGGGVKGFDFTTVLTGTYMCYLIASFGGIYGDHRVWINNQPLKTYTRNTGTNNGVQNPLDGLITAADTGTLIGNLQFATPGPHLVRVAGIGYVANSGGILAVNRNGRIHKPEASRYFGVLSDSYMDTGATTYDGVPNHISHLTGWGQWNMAEGGTGMNNPGLTQGVDHSYGSPATMAALAKAPELEVLIVNGSGNDLGYSSALVKQKMQELFDKIKAVRPTQKIFWVGIEPSPYFRNIFGDLFMVQREDELAELAMSHSNVIGVARPMRELWQDGLGSTDAPNGAGTDDFFNGVDHIHLSPAGCRHYAKMIVERLKPCRAEIGF